MKRKKLIRNITAAILLLSAAALILFFRISYLAPYKYTEDCLYSNKEDFERLSLCFSNLYSDGMTYAEYKEDTDYFYTDFKGDSAFSDNTFNNSNSYNEVEDILDRLREQYQKGSDYPVFSSVKAQYDNNGEMMLTVQAKKEKLKNGDGVNSPDIRTFYLLYIDENYENDSPKGERKPFCGNWYTWSADVYSG